MLILDLTAYNSNRYYTSNNNRFKRLIEHFVAARNQSEIAIRREKK